MNKVSINELHIKRLCEKYRYKCKIFDGKVFIISKKDEWIAETHCKYILLRHKNTKLNKTGKHHYHDQRKFYDWEFLFKSIHSHKKTYKCYNHMFKMKELFAQV